MHEKFLPIPPSSHTLFKTSSPASIPHDHHKLKHQKSQDSSIQPTYLNIHSITPTRSPPQIQQYQVVIRSTTHQFTMYQKIERKTKMKLLSIFKNKDNKQTMLQWSSCKHPKTLSFRSGDDIFKTTNSVYFDPLALNTSGETTHLESCFTNSSPQSTSSLENSSYGDESSVERIVREARSERLFFEPGRCNTSSILEVEAKTKTRTSRFFKESVVMAMDSEDPYLDFKSSMQEMVDTHGLKDWESLEELLGWYLKMNGKRNHGFIVGAFVDLLIGLSFSSSCCCCCSEHDHTFMSASSSFSSHLSPPLSPPAANREDGASIYQKDVHCTGPMKQF